MEEVATGVERLRASRRRGVVAAAAEVVLVMVVVALLLLAVAVVEVMRELGPVGSVLVGMGEASGRPLMLAKDESPLRTSLGGVNIMTSSLSPSSPSDSINDCCCCCCCRGGRGGAEAKGAPELLPFLPPSARKEAEDSWLKVAPRLRTDTKKRCRRPDDDPPQQLLPLSAPPRARTDQTSRASLSASHTGWRARIARDRRASGPQSPL